MDSRQVQLSEYEMREEEQRQERERLTEERNAGVSELEENDRRMVALLAQKRKAAQVASDKVLNSRIRHQYDRFGSVKSFALDLPVPVVKEPAHK